MSKKKKKFAGKADLQLSKEWIESDNTGTRHETAASSMGYWQSRMMNGLHDPFLVYRFRSLAMARQALLGTSFIHEARDTEKIICTEPIDFGCYRADDGAFIAMLAGAGFNIEMFEEAKASFIHNRGSPRNQGELRPPTPLPKTSSRGSPSQAVGVHFREDVVLKKVLGGEEMTFTYRIHTAASKVAAMRFLSHLPIGAECLYVVVETPEGTFCKDLDGIYVEGAPVPITPSVVVINDDR